MTSERHDMTQTTERVFEWHPEYQGRSLDDVQVDLAEQIAHDQRAYEVALMGAEESEHDALASVVDIERRWSPFSFGWNEADPNDLAARVAGLEWAREQQREMISWQEYRNTSAGGAPSAQTGGDWRASMSDEQRRKVANILAAVILGLVIVAIIVVLVLVL